MAGKVFSKRYKDGGYRQAKGGADQGVYGW